MISILIATILSNGALDTSRVLIAKEEPRQAVEAKVTDVKKPVPADGRVIVLAGIEDEEKGQSSNVYYEVKRDGTLTTWW